MNKKSLFKHISNVLNNLIKLEEYLKQNPCDAEAARRVINKREQLFLLFKEVEKLEV